MAGLVAWAADVVGGGGQSNDEDDIHAIPVAFTPEQQQYARQLDLKASSLNCSIQDLWLRLPPPDISQRLPHLDAHSLASNAALALQLNAHSTTKEQAQLREVTLQEENAAYEKAISNCDNKIQEKLKEADLFWTKLQIRVKHLKFIYLLFFLGKKCTLDFLSVALIAFCWRILHSSALKHCFCLILGIFTEEILQEMDLTEKNLKDKLEHALAALHARQSGKLGELSIDSETTVEAQDVIEASKSDVLDKLENKKKELSLMEEMVEVLEKKWAQVQENALKQPSPAQREKILDRQLHGLIEQLATKQAQAEGLVSEIHLKEMELERLNGLWRSLETSTAEVNAARNRFGRSNSEKGSLSSDYIVDPHHRPAYHLGGRTENLMLLRSAFVLYILALHILVFIRISF